MDNYLLNKVVCIDRKEEEIIDLIGVDFVKIQFFNINNDYCILPKKDIDKFLI